MLVLIGTVPADTGLYAGKCRLQENSLYVGDSCLPVERGTAAMAAAAARVCAFYGQESPVCIFGGDRADGRGTQLIFEHAGAHLEDYAPQVVALHYMFPKVVFGKPFLDAIGSLRVRPQLIADAGGMYLFKTIGRAFEFDVFTPDEGELYFLADEQAAHPLYVRQELLDQGLSRETLVETAYRKRTTARVTVVKGAIDYLYQDGRKVKEVSSPGIPAMEAVGGTGDTITGMLAAFRYCRIADGDYKALVLNRRIGQEIRCTPATQIAEFIKAIPAALEKYERTTG
ncbi:MAG TPA: NAD(P)H-hydrate dehydratase [Candidatus Omnitrophota bacterium]|nr:NAD(P)H-hydrate dehydratase [Candidatus Omnitrophota bacterium]HRZ14391.1 NAD(P)H-hydrate dehydratase [Candidatus Omnitrophota bacterium]